MSVQVHTLTLRGSSPGRNRSDADQEDIETRGHGSSANRPYDMLVLKAMAYLNLSSPDRAVRDEEPASAQVPTSAIVGSEDRDPASVKGLNGLIPDFELAVIQSATRSGNAGALRGPGFVGVVRRFTGEHRNHDPERLASICLSCADCGPTQWVAASAAVR